MTLLAAAVLAAAALANGAEPSADVAEVAGLLPGTYVSRDPARSLRVAIAAVPKSRIADAPVFYLEAARMNRPDAPFLQRFLALKADGDRLVLTVYEPRDLAGVRGKWRDPEALGVFSARDVHERPDCRIRLARAPAGHWTGGTSGATCRSAAASVPLAVSVSISPQTLEWREEGKDAAGKTVYGPAGEITIFSKEREGAAPAAATRPAAAAIPAAGEVKRDADFSSSGKEQAPADAPPALVVSGPSSPSKKYSLADLRAMAGAEGIPLKRFFEGGPESSAGAVVVATSRSGAVSVFSFAEISSSSGPSLDVSGAAPRLVAAPGRGLEDVSAIELRVLEPSR